MRHSARDTPEIFATEDQLILVLDSNGPRDLEDPDKRLREESPLKGQKLRFSVTRGGTLKFAKKVSCRPQEEYVDVLDDEGNPVPNPDYEREMTQYGNSNRDPHKRERQVSDTPETWATYDVDRKWWGRNGVTRVKF